MNLESDLQPAWFCSLLLPKACFIIFFFEFEARHPQKQLFNMHTLKTEVLC